MVTFKWHFLGEKRCFLWKKFFKTGDKGVVKKRAVLAHLLSPHLSQAGAATVRSRWLIYVMFAVLNLFRSTFDFFLIVIKGLMITKHITLTYGYYTGNRVELVENYHVVLEITHCIRNILSKLVSSLAREQNIHFLYAAILTRLVYNGM